MKFDVILRKKITVSHNNIQKLSNCAFIILKKYLVHKSYCFFQRKYSRKKKYMNLYDMNALIVIRVFLQNQT